jgi:hypothetical protein
MASSQASAKKNISHKRKGAKAKGCRNHLTFMVLQQLPEKVELDAHPLNSASFSDDAQSKVCQAWCISQAWSSHP